MATMQDLAAIIAQYPGVWNQFKNIPELMNVLVNAIGKNLTGPEIQDQLAQTNYWRTTTEAQRAWDQLSAVSPAEAAKRQADKVKMMQDTLTTLGLSAAGLGTPDDQAYWWLRDVNYVTSHDLNQQQTADYLVSMYSVGSNLNPDNARGTIAQTMGAIGAAAADYGLPTTPQDRLFAAQNIARGISTLDSVKGTYAATAKGMFAPEVGAAIDRGLTVRQFADPYVNIAAQNLEIGPDQVNLSDPKWQAFLKVPQVDAKSATGTSNRVMTTAEWQAKIRTDPSYGFDATSNGDAACDHA